MKFYSLIILGKRIHCKNKHNVLEPEWNHLNESHHFDNSKSEVFIAQVSASNNGNNII